MGPAKKPDISAVYAAFSRLPFLSAELLARAGEHRRVI